MPKGYIIAHVTVNDPDAYLAYVDRNNIILPPLGGRPLVRGGQCENVEGPQFDRHVIFEFPSYAAAQASYHNKEYQKNAEIRFANAKSMVVVVEGAE
jgi:uncharacterized protein (DUF1330 family)